MLRILSILSLLVALSACSDATSDLSSPVEPLGNFTLGHAIVVAPNVEQYLVSREATSEELIQAVDAQIEKRFRRFDGGKFYHMGISIEAYSLPPPVVPGKTFLAMRVTIWDDAAKTKLNDETKLISAVLLLETRLANSREDSIEAIAAEAAKQTEVWLREQMKAEGWFKGPVPASPAEAALTTTAPVPPTGG